MCMLMRLCMHAHTHAHIQLSLVFWKGQSAKYLLPASLCRYRCRSKKLSQRGGGTGAAVMAFNPRPKSEMEHVDDPTQQKQDGEMGEG